MDVVRLSTTLHTHLEYKVYNIGLAYNLLLVNKMINKLVRLLVTEVKVADK